MKNFKSSKEVLEIIENREQKLRNIVDSEETKLKETLNKEKILNASEYLEELEAVKGPISFIQELDVVPLKTLQRLLDNSDYVSLIYDEEYVILAQASNNPFDENEDEAYRDFYILWISPLKRI